MNDQQTIALLTQLRQEIEELSTRISKLEQRGNMPWDFPPAPFEKDELPLLPEHQNITYTNQ